MFTAVVSGVIGAVVYFGVNDGLKLRPSDGGVFGNFPKVSIPEPPPAASVVPVPPHQREAPARVPAGESLAATENGGARTVICDGGSVTISGSDNTVLVTGECLRVDVSGGRNVVRVTSSAAIGVSGTGNQVTYFSGDPDVTDTGSSNVVERS